MVVVWGEGVVFQTLVFIHFLGARGEKFIEGDDDQAGSQKKAAYKKLLH